MKKNIDQILAEHPFFAGLEPADLEYLAGCAWNEAIAEGQTIFRAGEPANRFYLIRHGEVALQLHAGSRGTLTLQTLHDGDILGWSWLFPPHRWQFDARANRTTRLTAFDGACLRGKCEENTRLGYELMKRFSGMLVRRFQETRLQLLDVYGKEPNAAR